MDGSGLGARPDPRTIDPFNATTEPFAAMIDALGYAVAAWGSPLRRLHIGRVQIDRRAA
jgi:hypothetical protein